MPLKLSFILLAGAATTAVQSSSSSGWDAFFQGSAVASLVGTICNLVWNLYNRGHAKRTRLADRRYKEFESSVNGPIEKSLDEIDDGVAAIMAAFIVDDLGVIRTKCQDAQTSRIGPAIRKIISTFGLIDSNQNYGGSDWVGLSESFEESVLNAMNEILNPNNTLHQMENLGRKVVVAEVKKFKETVRRRLREESDRIFDGGAPSPKWTRDMRSWLRRY